MKSDENILIAINLGTFKLKIINQDACKIILISKIIGVKIFDSSAIITNSIIIGRNSPSYPYIILREDQLAEFIEVLTDKSKNLQTITLDHDRLVTGPVSIKVKPEETNKSAACKFRHFIESSEYTLLPNNFSEMVDSPRFINSVKDELEIIKNLLKNIINELY